MRRFFRVLLLLVVGLVVAASAAAIFRVELATLAIRSQLAAMGFVDAQFRITRLELDRTQIDGLRLAPGLPEAGQIIADYTLSDLLSGQVAAVAIEDVAIDLGESGENLGVLRDAIGQEERTAEARRGALPAISLRNVSFLVEDPRWGPARLSFDADVTPMTGGADDGDSPIWRAEGEAMLASLAANGQFSLEAAASARDGAVQLQIDGAVEIDAVQAGAPLEVGVSAGELALQLDVAAVVPADADLFNSEGTAEILATVRDLTGADGAQASGVFALGVNLADGLLSLTPAPDAPTRLVVANAPALELVPQLEPDGAALTLETVAEDPLVAFDWRGDFVEFAAVIGLRIQSAQDASAASRASATLRAEAEALSFDALFDEISGSLDASLVDLIAAPTDGVISTLETARWDAAYHWRKAEEGGGALFVAGPLSAKGDVVAPDVAIGEATLDGEVWVDVAVAPDGAVTWSSHPQPGLLLTAERISVAERLALSEGPLLLALDFGQATGGAEGTEIAARGDVAGAAWSLIRSPTRRVPFEDVAGRFELAMTLPTAAPMSGRIQLAEARLRAPEWGVRFAGLDADFPLDPFAPEVARATLSGLVEDLSSPARFASAAVRLDATRDADAWRASGSVAAPTADLRAPVQAVYDLTRDDARIRIGPAPLQFRAGGPPPSAVSAVLAPIIEAQGRATLDLDLRINAAGRLRASGRVETDGLDLELDAARIEGLRGDIRIADVLAPQTRGTQTLEIDRIDPGAALKDVTLAFGLTRGPGGGPILALQSAGAVLAEGEIEIVSADIPLDGSPFSLDVDVAQLSLKALIEELSIANLNGDGRLTGRIPLRIAPEGLVIDDGRLAAEGPGVVQVDWGDARDPLLSQGEEVGWLVRALEDFRYEVLRVGLERPTDGALSVALSLSGSNPDVLDDQPFNFNINVRGDLEPILEAVREGRRIGSDLLESGLLP